uniref:Low density lipoprotein receptor class A domain containing 2 n=1 Tax=Equus caballus TaxID=9796 RepID=A0A3Q2HZC4_HORSE
PEEDLEGQHKDRREETRGAGRLPPLAPRVLQLPRWPGQAPRPRLPKAPRQDSAGLPHCWAQQGPDGGLSPAAAPEVAAAGGSRPGCVCPGDSLTPPSPAPPAPNASSPAPADPCAPGSYLQFYEGPPGAPRPLGAPLCGLTIPAPVASSGDYLGLRLVTRGRQPRVDFVGEATSFRLGSCGAYFRCGNGRCIPRSLVCDRWGLDNCGDGSDQAPWPPADCRGPSGAVRTNTSEPLTLSPTLGSAGHLRSAARRSPPAGRDPAQQDAAPGGHGRLTHL